MRTYMHLCVLRTCVSARVCMCILNLTIYRGTSVIWWSKDVLFQNVVLKGLDTMGGQ
jgi:hypothetical protein